MFMNGVKTGLVTTMVLCRIILKEQIAGRIVCVVVVAGVAMTGIAGCRAVIMLLQVSGVRPSVSDLPFRDLFKFFKR